MTHSRTAGAEPAAGQPDGTGTAELLSLRDIRVEFGQPGALAGRRRRRVVRALDGVSLDVGPGESVAIVGESGSGKTTLGRVICRLQRVAAGRALFRGQDLRQIRGPALRDFRRQVQMIFQDPYASLDPRLRVGPVIAEPLLVNRIGSAAERQARVAELLATVGLPQDLAPRYPHELSGGQRQRVAIARALALSPQLIVADEPTSALDVSAQAQILTLLDSLRHRLGVSLVYITHNLPTAAYVADRAAVMYLGQIIETGPAADVLLSPSHPYTAALCSAAPTLDVLEQPGQPAEAISARGEPPDPGAPPAGCRFHPRCWFREQVADPARCAQEQPALAIVAAGRTAACHYSQELAGATFRQPANPGGAND
jgi:peptide/nickel transport system ATP-binding protein